MRARGLAFVVGLSLVLTAASRPSDETAPEVEPPPEAVVGREVVLRPIGSTRLEMGGVRYRGPFEITGHPGGLGVTEAVSVRDYMYGIAEVPFAWHPEALEAQAVAARTYLAWTLARGRSESGRAYGYDICATTACQVYSGIEYAVGEFGRPWRAAVDGTADEILLHDGRPAQALYSSTSGGRTRNVEDVFPGAAPTPYLTAVESPGEDSPFVEWSFELSDREMGVLLAEAGLLEGELIGVTNRRPGDGDGSWTVTVIGTEGISTIGTWSLRTELNAAAEVLGDRLPPERPDVDRRYPQTILSPSFTIEARHRVLVSEGEGPPTIERYYRVAGNGWGHNVGMSQFGAQAMAESGSSHSDILAHYYGGLRPRPAGSWLPENLVVGLAAGADELEVSPDGPVEVVVDGQTFADLALGTWRFRAVDGFVEVRAPVGLGLPPAIIDAKVLGVGRTLLAVEAVSATAAELRLSGRVGGRWVPVTDWRLVDAGPTRWGGWEIGSGRIEPTLLRVEARSPLGLDVAYLAAVSGAE